MGNLGSWSQIQTVMGSRGRGEASHGVQAPRKGRLVGVILWVKDNTKLDKRESSLWWLYMSLEPSDVLAQRAPSDILEPKSSGSPKLEKPL